MLPVYHYQTVTTVLDIAHELCREGRLPVFGSVLAHAQTSGRGQMRRAWLSPPGNIYFAVRLPETGPFGKLAAAPALGAVLADSLVSLGFPVALKWPNDIIVKTRTGWGKAAGILLEQRKHLIAGIGINLIQAPPQKMLRENAMLPAAALLDAADGRTAAGILSRAEQARCCFHYVTGEMETPCSDDETSAMQNLSESDNIRDTGMIGSSFLHGGKNWFSLFEYLVCGIKVWYENSVNHRNGTGWRELASKHMAFIGKLAIVEDALLSEGENETVQGVISGLGENGELLLDTPFGVKYIFGGSLRIADSDY